MVTPRRYVDWTREAFEPSWKELSAGRPRPTGGATGLLAWLLRALLGRAV